MRTPLSPPEFLPSASLRHVEDGQRLRNARKRDARLRLRALRQRHSRARTWSTALSTGVGGLYLLIAMLALFMVGMSSRARYALRIILSFEPLLLGGLVCVGAALVLALLSGHLSNQEARLRKELRRQTRQWHDREDAA